MKDKFNTQEPAKPAEYSYKGPLSDLDRKWLEELNKRLWTDSYRNRRCTEYYERHNQKLSWDDLRIIFSLIKNHKLPTTMTGQPM